MNYILLILLILLNDSAFTIYDLDKESLQTSKRPPLQYSYSCIVFNGSLGHGTGSFVAPNVVMTARHAVTQLNKAGSDEDFTLIDFDDIRIHRDEHTPIEAKVLKIEILKEFDVALIILGQNIKDVAPVPVKAVNEGETFDIVTYMGFGAGGLLSHEDQSKLETELFIKKSIAFRSSTNDDQKNKSMKSTLVRGTRVGMLDHDKLSQDIYLTHVAIAPGDSGGAIINKDGNLIAINRGGSLYGHIERIKKEDNEIFDKIKTKLSCISNVSQDYLSDDNVYQELYKIFNEQRKFQYASLGDPSKSFATANENFRNAITKAESVLIKANEDYALHKMWYDNELSNTKDLESQIAKLKPCALELERMKLTIMCFDKQLSIMRQLLFTSESGCFSSYYTLITPLIKEWIVETISANKL